jgi:glycosyltransferase involved in cell wall biosynthesis
MNSPLVSVIIPCYNTGIYLEDAIRSAERFPDKSLFEIIVVNDGSTEDLTKAALAKFRDEGILIIDQENKGLPAARNTGIRNAKGEYILPLDSDNCIEPDFISESIRIFRTLPEAGVVYGNALYFGDKSGVWKLKRFDFASMLLENQIDACACFRKSVWEKAGGYDEKMRLGWEDWEFWLRVSLTGTRFIYLDQILFHYRVRKDSLVSVANRNHLAINEYIFEKEELQFLKSVRSTLSVFRNITDRRSINNEFYISEYLSRQLSMKSLLRLFQQKLKNRALSCFNKFQSNTHPEQ